MNQSKIRLTCTLCMVFLFAQKNVSAQLGADFSATPLSGCAPLIVNFTDLSTGGPTSWHWDLGNGTISTLQNPTASYFSAGSYSVKLVIHDATGADSITRQQYIIVFPKPICAFTASDTTGCFPHAIQFTDQSIPSSGTITSWLWDFGDGTTSLLHNPSHTYTNGGSFTVSLRVVNSDGCSATLTKTSYINIAAGVIANFTNSLPAACSNNPTINFTNLSTGPGPLTYQWNFGDGGTSTLTNPSHTYTTQGTFSVSLIAISPQGCRDTLTRVNLISSGATQSQFTYPTTACAGSPVNFVNTSTPIPVSSTWYFGDGTSAIGLTATKSYALPGTYTIKLVNIFGACSDSITHNITINPKPTAAFTGSPVNSCQAPLNVTFDATTSANSIYAWDFGDGGSSSLEDPVHVYAAAGSYTVRLIVTGNNGCADTLTRTNYVTVAPPAVTIAGLPRTGCVPITILPVSTVATIEPITSYLWNFGDGTTSAAATPSHTYNTPGNYDVTLTIVTASGCTQTVTVVNAVKAGAKPQANFTVNPPDVCAMLPVNFFDASTGGVDQWQWDFGDGSQSILQNPTHIYSDTGYFNVTLVVWSNTCPDTIKFNQIVHIRPPIARFSIADTCAAKFTKRFIDQSIGALTWAWDFGDGTTSNVQNPTHTYTATGTYTVTLVVTNGPCSFTTSQSLDVIDEHAVFTADHSTICRNSAVAFSAPSIQSANIQAWEWDFGDGTAHDFNASTVSHVYTSSGVFNVKLKITDAHGCEDSSTVVITVFGPTADFTAPGPNICLGNSTATFNDHSTTDGQHPILNWQWNFGDGMTQTFTSSPFSHTYMARGSYDVTLKVTDNYGCTDSLAKLQAIIVTRPTADFSSPDTLTCTNKPVSFLNTSTGVTPTYKWNFGDGGSSIVTNPTHNYTLTGIYSVQLIAKDQYGCRDTLLRPSYINISLPRAVFTVSDSFSTCPPLLVTFNNQAQNSTTVNWDFGDGNTSSLTNPTHIYTIAGIYIAKQIVTGPGGCIDSISKQIVIKGPSGTFNYSPKTGCNPLTVSFTATTRNHASIIWDFTDGNTATTTGLTISHTYTALGDYLPRMILVDSGGCIVPVLGTEPIHVTGIHVDFSMNKTSICDSGKVIFTNNSFSNDSISLWQWSFGDGTASNVQNPQHTYTIPGNYIIKLLAVTSSGCRDSLIVTDSIHVYSRPLIAINGVNSACAPATLQFNGQVNRGNPSLISWSWGMGNNHTDSTQSPSPQLYSTAGTYTIKAMVVDEHNCRDTVKKIITIRPFPVISAGPDKVVCLGTPVQLQATGGTTYSWQPPASLSCTGCSNPLANPPDNAVYVVEGFNQFGCSRFDTVSILVRKPFPMSYSNGDTLCIGESAHLSASGADTYAWSPTATLDNSTIPNPVANPVTTTIYRVIGTDNDNCFHDTANILIKVYPIPRVDAGDDQTITAGSPLRINAFASSDVTKYLWTPAYNISCTSCEDPTVTPGRTTQYNLEVSNDGGCTSKDAITISVTCGKGNLFIPNTFSPNGNGVNEFFYPRGTGIAKIKSFRVFNRWGEVVFERLNFDPNNASFGWDGTFKGKMLTADVFIYTCDVVCENNIVLSYKGDVTLLR